MKWPLALSYIHEANGYNRNVTVYLMSLVHMVSQSPGEAPRRAGRLLASLLACGLMASCDLGSSALGLGSLTVSARVVPSREWVLQQGTDGEISGSLIDHLQGRRLYRLSLSSERGDRVHFRTVPELTCGASVAAGDTIGHRVSALTAQRQVELQGQLDVERAYLKLAQSGDKASLVREADVRLTLARAEADQQRRELARQRSLFERNLVAPADMELAEAAVETADLRIRIAEEELQTALTGSRDQEIAWIEARIADLQRQVEQVRLDLAADVVCAPIGGRFVGGRGDTLAVVQDTTTWAAIMPVAWTDRRRLRAGLGVELRWAADLTPATGQLTRFGAEAFSTVDGRQFVAAVAQLHSVDGALVPGLVGQCRIACEPQTWREQLHHILAL